MDKTVAEWCKARHLSRSTYHKLKNLGRGPKELEIPGTRIKRITPEADAEWEARMTELAKSETARLEAERHQPFRHFRCSFRHLTERRIS
jgi:hypothetical protein